MQKRESQIPLEQPRPVCHINAAHKVYGHGFYQRLSNYLKAVLAVYLDIPRWRCVPCGRTWSVLPEGLLPYRPVPVEVVQKYFDAQANEQSAPPTPSTPPDPLAQVIQEGCLKRAWHRFTLRLTVLAACLGQLMQREDLADAKHFWLGLRRWGNLEEILRRLSADFQTSLLHDYRCIRAWSAP